MVSSRTTILTEVVDLSHRLGRHVEHDAKSAAYAIEADLSKPLTTVLHERKLPILDQGNLGSCTGNAGTGLLGTEPFYSQIGSLFAELNEAFAVKLYSDATVVDGYPGDYPPEDTGSSGLAIGKVLRGRGLIKSYRHAFGLLHALHAIQKLPVIIGIPWYSSFDSPGNDGLLTLDTRSGIRGGHELEIIGMDVVNGDPNSPEGVVHVANSWSTSWGASGYCELAFADFGTLLKNQGDVMTFGLKA